LPASTRVLEGRSQTTIDTFPEAPQNLAPEIPVGSARLAELLGARPSRNRFGEHLALRRWFSEPVGGDPPDRNVDEAVLRLLAPGAPADVADPNQWLFLDTETTGLAGGTGTYAFLVGIAWWDAGGLEVEQFFMREHGEEHSLLVALAERMAKRRVLVTFNGKCFDWPLLEARYLLTRSIRPPVPRAHLDFLQPSRSLWRLRLGSVRLPELERAILGWNRGLDVECELIPAIYFDFLRGGAPEALVPIFHHNQMDLRGLAGLAERVITVLADPASAARDAFELFGVSRICERRGEGTRARKFYQQSISSELPPEPARLARKALARLAKRDGDFALACEVWTQLLGTSRDGLEAYEELAIHFERRAREFDRAVALVRGALSELRCASHLGTLAPTICARYQGRFERRLARLERKANRARTRHPSLAADARGLKPASAPRDGHARHQAETGGYSLQSESNLPDSESNYHSPTGAIRCPIRIATQSQSRENRNRRIKSWLK
jgi:uncharacterized protein YprB with RNaseH-like and TPR domain